MLTFPYWFQVLPYWFPYWMLTFRAYASLLDRLDGIVCLVLASADGGMNDLLPMVDHEGVSLAVYGSESAVHCLIVRCIHSLHCIHSLAES